MIALAILKSVAKISLLVSGIVVAAILFSVVLDWFSWARESVVIVPKEW